MADRRQFVGRYDFPRQAAFGGLPVRAANSHGRAISGQGRLKRTENAYIVLLIAGSGDIRVSGFVPVELVFQRNYFHVNH